MQAVDLSPQQPRQGLGFRNGDQGNNAGVGENTNLAAQVVLDLRQAGGRVDGHRNAAGEQNTEESSEEFPACRQHQRHGLLGLQAACLQTGGHRFGGALQVGVGDRFSLVAVTDQCDMRPFGMILNVPRQGVDQCTGRAWRLADGWRFKTGHRRHVLCPGSGTSPPQGVPQGAWDVGVGDVLLRQVHAKRLLQAVQQFHAFQAVEAEVAIQQAVERNGGRRGTVRVQFGRELPDDAEEHLDGLLHDRGFGRAAGHQGVPANRAASAAVRVCAIRVAMVMGPTPPGTGV